MLVQATVENAKDETDPVLDAFLGFIRRQMELRPDLISAVTRADRRDANKILRGTRSDPDADLGDNFELPGSRPVARSRKPSKRIAGK